LLDAILEKDVSLQELEDTNEQLECRLSTFINSGMDEQDIEDVNKFKSMSNTISHNLKSQVSKRRSPHFLFLIILIASSTHTSESDTWGRLQLVEKFELYQLRLGQAERSSANSQITAAHLQKTITKMTQYLTNIGLSMDEIVKACETGVLRFGSLNTDIFKFD